MPESQNIIEVSEDIVSIIQINQGPKGDAGVAGGIASTAPSGGYTIKNIYLDATKKIVVVYDETPVS